MVFFVLILDFAVSNLVWGLGRNLFCFSFLVVSAVELDQ